MRSPRKRAPITCGLADSTAMADYFNRILAIMPLSS